MGDETQTYIKVAAAAGQTVVWLTLALVCLARARTGGKPPAWASLGAVGATLLFVPAMTGTAGNLQLVFTGSPEILQNLQVSTLPVFFTLMQVTGASLLLGALLVGRRPAAATSPVAEPALAR